MAKYEDSNRPLSQYNIPVNELLEYVTKLAKNWLTFLLAQV